ncbi:MAG: TonB-dependent receptor [Flavobacteriaceae bacterium]|nr:MAG: TonB-dependent receptor [Flavobacteriaceae bacterium]
MRKTIVSLFLSLFVIFSMNSQSLSSVKGTVSDSDTGTAIAGVTVKVLGTTFVQKTDSEGNFVLQQVPKGQQIVQLIFDGYDTQNYPVDVLEGKQSDLGVLLMYKEMGFSSDLSVISLSDDDLLEDEGGGSDNVSGLLSSSKDAFSRAAAFNFGAAWFRVRGFDSENGTVMLNGITMNKMYAGRPQWSNWGGLNDATRNQEVTLGLAPSNKVFGGVLGTTNISTRASEYRPGTKITASATNKNYSGRIMATHASGMKNKWAYVFSTSRRFASEGYFEGSTYDANSMFAAVEYQPNDRHSLNFTAIYAVNHRGKNSGNTQEVWDLMGNKYNSYWGRLDGKKRNARRKEVAEPIFMLTHEWDIYENTQLSTSVGYQFGKIGNSRLGYFNVRNPDPVYYKNLPSYFANSLDPNEAINAAYNLQNDERVGQLNWEALYAANLMDPSRSARFYLYEDRNDDNQFSFNTVLSSEISEHIGINVGLSYRNLQSNNYAKMLDLLGASHFYDEGQYTLKSSNLLGNGIISNNDTFSYNYNLDARTFDVFTQLQFNYNKVDFYVAGNVSNTKYQREGLFQNEVYEDTSYGKGRELNFDDFSVKGGATYKITGRHLIDFNAGYLTKAPLLKNAYSNARVNHDVVLGIDSETVKTVDLGYIFRAPGIKARLTGYYAKFENGTDISRYFDESLGEFVSEVLTGVNRKHFGAEFGLEYNVTQTIKAIAVAAVGQYTYDNNPLSYYTSDESFIESVEPTTSYIKDYKVAGTPQQAYSLGLEYRDPKYWWVGVNANHMSHTYVDVSSGLRTDRFYTNPDTNQPFAGVSQSDIDEVLKQERFDDYVLVNLTGGKSWRINGKYVSLFASVNNVLNTAYKTGGYEQGRKGNYELLKEDQSRETPLFGSKYWYGYGTSFYINFSVSF